jgi:hypothetical protein
LADTGDFSFSQNIQTTPEPHLASCSMGIRGSFPEVEWLGCAGTNLHVLLILGMRIAIPLLHLYVFIASSKTFFFNDSLCI